MVSTFLVIGLSFTHVRIEDVLSEGRVDIIEPVQSADLS